MKNTTLLRTSIALAAVAMAQSALADTEFKNDNCAFTVGGQFQFSAAHTTRRDDVIKANDGIDTQQVFLDLKTGASCSLNAQWDVETMLRMRPLKGNTFSVQGQDIGSREAWIGLRHKDYGALRWGRFLNKMMDQVDDFGAPSLYAEASAYSATPGDMTRRMGLRYLAPELLGVQPEVTVSGGPGKSRDLELYAKYGMGAVNLEGIYARSVMNGAYELAKGGAIGTGNRSLVNSSSFAGLTYDLPSGGKIRVGGKFNKFSMPSNATGFYDLNGTIKTVTDVNAFLLSAEYPLGGGFSINGSFLRYFDSKTRGVKANDGAKFFSATVKYEISEGMSIALGYKMMRLDQSGAIPGSNTGANQAIPETTVSALALADRQWVFGQNFSGGANAFKIPKYNQVNITFSKDF